MSYQGTLTLDLKSYWHAGSGRGSGSGLDALVCKTAQQLPLVPGKTLKGLLRDAVNRWEAFGGDTTHRPDTEPSVTDQLFGPRGVQGAVTYKGLLRFSSARLEPDVERYLAHDNNKPLRARLYSKHLSTAIDHKSGTALDKSLRGIEVAIPMRLQARIEEVDDAEYSGLSGQWIDLVSAALPLVRSIGSGRSRGFGRCVMTLEKTP